MIENFTLKDGRIVEIKRLTIDDYKTNDNYKFVHTWIHKVNKYLNKEFNSEDLDKDRSDFYEHVITNEQEIFIGAKYEGNIVASASLTLNLNSPKYKHIGGWGIVIHPDFHNQGLGKRLLTILEEKAKEKGILKLEADYYKGNDPAEHLYLNILNHEIEGVRKSFLRLPDGSFTDKIMIGKFLDENIKEKEEPK